MKTNSDSTKPAAADATPAKPAGARLRFEFWFEFASTYSYLSAARLPGLSRARGVPVIYKPFLLGPIFQAQGWNDSPFNIYPAKGRYMWRDLERQCEEYGLAYKRPAEFPRNGLRAARIATALLQSPDRARYAPDFTRTVYEANFVHDQNIAEESILLELLARQLPEAQEAAAIVSLSKSAQIKNQLRETTDRAQALGVFGAPFFVVIDEGAAESELFWGDDRLEAAFAYYAKKLEADQE
ncbi:MAG: 2-hydroxychromene-2-carboxylate isomerase [Leptospirales bacterium]